MPTRATRVELRILEKVICCAHKTIEEEFKWRARCRFPETEWIAGAEYHAISSANDAESESVRIASIDKSIEAVEAGESGT